MLTNLAKTAITYAVIGASFQAGQELLANRKLVKVKIKKVVNAIKN